MNNETMIAPSSTSTSKCPGAERPQAANSRGPNEETFLTAAGAGAVAVWDTSVVCTNRAEPLALGPPAAADVQAARIAL